MLVSIVLTAATVCTARACPKRLDETQWSETRDETYPVMQFCKEKFSCARGAASNLVYYCKNVNFNTTVHKHSIFV